MADPRGPFDGLPGVSDFFAPRVGGQPGHVLVVVGVVPQGMPFFHHTLDQLGVPLGAVADHEEGGLYVPLAQGIEDGGGGGGVRTVVEGQGDPVAKPRGFARRQEAWGTFLREGAGPRFIHDPIGVRGLT